MDRASELALVERLRAGDPEAFDCIHAAYNTRLFNFLARLTQRRDVAEDLLEETWLRLVAHGATLRPDTQLAAWLYRVARNLYASYCRARMVEDSHAASLLTLWPGTAARCSPYESAAARQVERRIESVLPTLPVRYREALLLVGVEGWSPQQAAQICGVTPAAMRQRLSRARDLLARRLDALERPPLSVLKEIKT